VFKFEKLDVWQKSISFDEEILMFSDRIPQKEQFSLGEQLRRASLSISTILLRVQDEKGLRWFATSIILTFRNFLEIPKC